jgi:CBS-domain-containing membrane protein
MAYVSLIREYLENSYDITDVTDEEIEAVINQLEVELGVAISHLLTNNIKDAIILVASAIAYNKKSKNVNIKTEKIGDYSYTIADTTEVDKIGYTLDIYKRSIMKFFR